MDLTLERTSRPSLPGSMISSSISEGEKPDARRSMISSPDPKHSTVWPLAARNAARYSRILLSLSTTRIDRLFIVKVLLVVRDDGWQSEQERPAFAGLAHKNSSSVPSDHVVNSGQMEFANVHVLRRRLDRSHRTAPSH